MGLGEKCTLRCSFLLFDLIVIFCYLLKYSIGLLWDGKFTLWLGVQIIKTIKNEGSL